MISCRGVAACSFFVLLLVGCSDGDDGGDDVNADGIRQPGDVGLGGWSVFLDTNLNGLPDTGEASVDKATLTSTPAN